MSSDAGGDADMQRMYQTTGPVKTIEIFSQTSSQNKKASHQSQRVEKQLYLCERCFDMNLFPPLTNRAMFCEKLENRKFVTMLQQQLNEDFKNEEAVSLFVCCFCKYFLGGEGQKGKRSPNHHRLTQSKSCLRTTNTKLKGGREKGINSVFPDRARPASETQGRRT